MKAPESAISRRRFLTQSSVFTAGFLLGATGLPASSRGRRFDIDPDFFVLVADTHIHTNINRVVHGSNMYQNLNDVVDRIIEKADECRPAGVFILGDFADTRGHIAEYVNARPVVRRLNEAGIPVHYALGNHDNRNNFHEVFPEEFDRRSPVPNRHVRVIDAPNQYHVILDTLGEFDEFKVHGDLGRAQLEWLDRLLEARDDKPVILHGHHYPWPNYQSGGGLRGLEDYRDFVDITLARRQVKAYCFGHSHRFDIDPVSSGRVNFDINGLGLFNVPTTRGHAGTQPVGFINALFYPDRIEFDLELIDKTDPRHGSKHLIQFRDGV